MMVSDPAGAVVALHEPMPELRVMVQSVSDPSVTTTDPVGVPAADATVALYMTDVP